MREHILFNLVFLAQVLLISGFFANRILRRMRYVAKHYPPSEYPRLYPRPLEFYESRQRLYGALNLVVLVIGLVLVGIGLLVPTEEMLGWDSISVLTIYMALQWSPLLILAHGGLTYFGCRRIADSRSTRKAQLRPRRLFDFVSPLSVGTAIGVYLGFIGLVLYIRQFDFPWFGGYWNLVGVTLLNVFLGGAIAWHVYSRARDPYQDYEDRLAGIGGTIRLLVATSIIGTLFIALNIGLRAAGLAQLVPFCVSLYFQLLAILSLRMFRVDNVNFEVYREEALSA